MGVEKMPTPEKTIVDRFFNGNYKEFQKRVEASAKVYETESVGFLKSIFDHISPAEFSAILPQLRQEANIALSKIKKETSNSDDFEGVKQRMIKQSAIQAGREKYRDEHGRYPGGRNSTYV